jgi:hypothetical protein
MLQRQARTGESYNLVSAWRQRKGSHHRDEDFCSRVSALALCNNGLLVKELGQCTTSFCKNKSTFKARVEYLFPQWFLFDIFTTLTIAITGHPAFDLSILKVTTGGPDTLRLIKANDLKSIQLRFSKGEASPQDVYENVFTALYVGRPDTQFGTPQYSLYSVLICGSLAGSCTRI